MTNVIDLNPRDGPDLHDFLRAQITAVLVERGRLDNMSSATIDARIEAAMGFVELCLTSPLKKEEIPLIEVALPDTQAKQIEDAFVVQGMAIVKQLLSHFLATLPAIVAGRSR